MTNELQQIAQPEKVEQVVDAIVKAGESTRRVVETMAMMASGRATLSRKITIHDLFEIEEAVLGSSLSRGTEAIDELTRHLFADGIYIREMTIPEGHMLTGAIHKTAHMSVMSCGDISVLTVDGIKRLAAPCVVRAEPGIKRIGFAHETTVWMDVHPNPSNERDVDKLWDMYYHNNKPKD